MENLLTVRQLQEILQVDRITVYRMLADGRLAGVKVGGQWRFRDTDVQQLLELHAPTSHTGAAILPIPCIQAMQEVFAQALDVAVVATDLAGVPITKWSNACPFCELVLSTTTGRQRCQECWADLTQHTRHHRLYRCHAGLAYTRSLIEVDGKRVGLFIAGQLRPSTAERDDESLHQVAESCGLSLAELRSLYATVHVLDEPQTTKLLQLIQTMALAVCRIGQERQKLISRLDRIAAISSET